MFSMRKVKGYNNKVGVKLCRKSNDQITIQLHLHIGKKLQAKLRKIRAYKHTILNISEHF